MTAGWTGAASALLGAAIGVCIALVCWLPDAGVSGHPGSAIRAGLLGFLAAHHAGVTVDGVPVDFVPLLATAVLAAIAWRAGAVLGEVATRCGETRGRHLGVAVVVQAACYADACAFLATVATLGTSSASPVRAGVAGFVLFSTVAGTALCRSPLLAHCWRARVSPMIVDGTGAGVAAAVMLIGSGALLAGGSLVMHAERVMRLSGAVGGGLSGTSIMLLGMLTAPNAAVAGAAYISGPGFAIGTGTLVSPLATARGTLPAFPILGAVPAAAAGPIVLGYLALTLLTIGLVVTRLLACHPPADGIRALAIAALSSGMALALLCWLAGGALGTGRLRTVGPSAWRVACLTAGEIAAIGLVLLTGCWLWRWVTSWIGRGHSPKADRTLVSIGGARVRHHAGPPRYPRLRRRHDVAGDHRHT